MVDAGFNGLGRTSSSPSSSSSSTSVSASGIAPFVVACVDYDGLTLAGNDTSARFGNGSTMAVALASAITTPFKTLERVGQILSGFGNGGTLVVLIRPRTAGATYKKIDTVTDEDLLWMNPCAGWLRVLVRATADFSNNAADKIICGHQIAGTTNVGGYNATTATTTNLSVVQLAGGGAPGFPAEASGFSAISGKRIRFDPATTTVALRNATQMIMSNTTTAIVVGSALPAVPAAGDIFYIEEPAARIGLFNSSPGANQVITVVGLRSTGAGASAFSAPGSTVSGAGLEMTGSFSPARMVDLVLTRTYPDEGGASVAVGTGFRSDGQMFLSSIAATVTVDYSSTVGTTQFSINSRLSGSLTVAALACLFRTGVSLGNLSGGSAANPLLSFGVYAIGPGLRITATPGGATGAIEINTVGGATIRGGDITNQTKALVRIGGCDRSNFTINGLTSVAGGNTDVIVDVTGGNFGTNVAIGQSTANTATSTVGDIRLTGSVIAPFAGLATTNYVDSGGNNFIGNGGVIVERGVNYTNSSGGAIAQFSVVRSNGTTGQMTTAQADTAAHAAGILGVCITAPANGALGLVVPAGGQTWVQFDASTPTAGGIAYLSVGTVGDAQSGIPANAATNQKNRLGIVGKVSGTLGLTGFSPDKLAVTADGSA